MSERGRRGQETGSRIKLQWDTLSRWDGTQPLPSAGDIKAEGSRLGDKERWAREGERRTDRECVCMSTKCEGILFFLKFWNTCHIRCQNCHDALTRGTLKSD